MQDETLGLLTDPVLGTAAQEILAGKLFTHSQTLCPRLVVVDKAGCCGGTCPGSSKWALRIDAHGPHSTGAMSMQ